MFTKVMNVIAGSVLTGAVLWTGAWVFLLGFAYKIGQL